MSKDKILSVATAAFEVTKMVLTIAAHTTYKLAIVGKEEIVKQYQEYQQRATPQQLEALNAFKKLTLKGTELAKTGLETAKKKAKENVPKPKEGKK